VYENTTLGKISFYADDFRYNYYYGRVLFLDSETVPNELNDQINSIGAGYGYRKNKWRGNINYSNTLSGAAFANLDANATFSLNDRNRFSFRYHTTNRIPDHIFNLHQSSFVGYNWYNDFKNEKINTIEINAETQFANA